MRSTQCKCRRKFEVQAEKGPILRSLTDIIFARYASGVPVNRLAIPAPLLLVSAAYPRICLSFMVLPSLTLFHLIYIFKINHVVALVKLCCATLYYKLRNFGSRLPAVSVALGSGIFFRRGGGGVGVGRWGGGWWGRVGACVKMMLATVCGCSIFFIQFFLYNCLKFFFFFVSPGSPHFLGDFQNTFKRSV